MKTKAEAAEARRLAKEAAKLAWKVEVEAMEAIDRRVEERVGTNCVVDYSAYKTDDNDVAVDNLDEIAFRGKIIFYGERDEFYGGKRSKDYRSPVLENPTWLDLCVVANEMILATNDHHHCFLEGIQKVKRSKVTDRLLEGVNIGNDVQIAEFSMGS